MLDTSRWSDRIISIEASKIDCLLEHLLRLDGDARSKRFCHLVSDEYLHDYVRRLDLMEARIIGFFGAGQMHAAVELRPTGSPRARAFEAAITVERNWQGRGIGTALMLRTITVARALGANHIVMDCLAGNLRMRRIIARFEADLLFGNDDCTAWLPVSGLSRNGSAQAPVSVAR